jgi:hypothetical protein
MHIFLLLLFALALFGGSIFGRVLALVIRIAFLLILAGLFIHP